MQGNLPAFAYVGIDAHGKRVNGSLNASDLKTAQAILKKQNIAIISLAPKKNLGFFKGKQKITQKDIQLFTRFLSTMLTAGLPIIQALDIVGQDQENKSLQSLIASLRKDISGGKTLAETFNQYPQYFNELYVSLLKAGEKSGSLDKILLRLANYLERIESLKKKIKKALTYPLAILAVAGIVSGVLLIFVVPQFQQMFASVGAQLPFFTRMVVNLSDALRQKGIWLVLIVFGIVLYLRYMLKTKPKWQQVKDRIILRIFVIGPVLKKGIIARFTRTLATTLEAGMPIVESMRTLAPVMGNSLYSQAINKICEDLNSGHALSESMLATEIFPNMVIQMIGVGEASGRLAEMLNKIADYYDEEVSHIVDNLSSLLEPLIMVILGLVVGSFVVAMYLPIFKMGSLF